MLEPVSIISALFAVALRLLMYYISFLSLEKALGDNSPLFFYLLKSGGL